MNMKRLKNSILSNSISVIMVLAICLVLSLTVSAQTEVITVTDIKKYGNLELSISGTDFLAQGYTYGDIVTVTINGADYDMPVCTNYSDVEQGSMVCRVVITPDTNEDKVILAINMGDLATATGIATKEKIEADPGYVVAAQ